VRCYVVVTTSSTEAILAIKKYCRSLAQLRQPRQSAVTTTKTGGPGPCPARSWCSSKSLLHDLAQLDIEPQAAGVAVVVSGHSHKPVIQDRNGVLYINPGSAGPRRFKLPIAIAEMRITGKSVTARIIELDVSARLRS
jgi:calcineurin-like phosphoesterase family protein